MVRMTVASIIIMVMVGIVSSYTSVTLIISGGAPTTVVSVPLVLVDAIG